jgi:hypothetical protein
MSPPPVAREPLYAMEEEEELHRRPMPQSQPATRQPHIQPPQYAAMNNQRSIPQPQPAMAPAPNRQLAAEEEDLEIPAFIRKKLM